MARLDSRELDTTAAVIHALGGLKAVEALTGAPYKLVSGWGKAETFPSRYFLVMIYALRRRRLSARPELWRQVTPAERRRALAAAIAAHREQVAA